MDVFKFLRKKEELVKPERCVARLEPKFERTVEDSHETLLRTNIQEPIPRLSPNVKGFAQDGFPVIGNDNLALSFVPLALMDWYGAQGFIGYNLCAIFAQHWLIDKACSVPAKDATRNGYDLTVNDAQTISPEILSYVRDQDTKYNVLNNCVELVKMGRVYGIRVAMFHVDSDDPNYYEKPFNIDGVVAGSYRGISQIDPFYITPELDAQASACFAAKDFLEPTWWRIGSRRIHRTHLIVFRTGHIPDILKPTYFYGGVPIPQKLYEHVYNAERSANEGPQLLLTKRMDVYKLDKSQGVANEATLLKEVQYQSQMRDNFGTKVIDITEDMLRLDTNLTGVDEVIMTQYQLVAAAANVPVVKLLGTSPKGFNATGEYEEASYREELQNIQVHDLTPLLTRHYELLIKSEVMPKFGVSEFAFKIVWKPCDSMTVKEKAEVQKIKADTAVQIASVGAIDGQDERNRIISDEDSGYNGLEETAPEPDLTDIEPLKRETIDLN